MMEVDEELTGRRFRFDGCPIRNIKFIIQEEGCTGTTPNKV
jgi:hypothetical protein